MAKILASTFPEAHASREQVCAQTCGSGLRLMPSPSHADTAEPESLGRGEVLRCSIRLVISTNPACLHGPVNRGAEKIADLSMSPTCYGDDPQLRNGRIRCSEFQGRPRIDSINASLPDFAYLLPGIIHCREGRSSRRSGPAHRCGHPVEGKRSPHRRGRGPPICDGGSRSQWRGCP